MDYGQEGKSALGFTFEGSPDGSPDGYYMEEDMDQMEDGQFVDG